MRLSFEITPPVEGDNGAEVEIYLDIEGRDRLVKLLSEMNERSEHFHMFSEAWGSDELTEERRSDRSFIGRHVKVYLRPTGEPLWDAERKN